MIFCFLIAANVCVNQYSDNRKMNKKVFIFKYGIHKII